MTVRSGDGTAAASIRTEGGASYEIEAPWGVASDGYHSSVREFLTIGTSRRDYGASNAVADFEGVGRILDEGTSCIALEPARPHGFFRFEPERWRMIYRINEGKRREQMVGDEEVRRLIRQFAPGFGLNRILWASAFRLGQQQSEAYHAGRWVLAGDAAHGMGPSAGAGMQVGVLRGMGAGLAAVDRALAPRDGGDPDRRLLPGTACCLRPGPVRQRPHLPKSRSALPSGHGHALGTAGHRRVVSICSRADDGSHRPHRSVSAGPPVRFSFPTSPPRSSVCAAGVDGGKGCGCQPAPCRPP